MSKQWERFNPPRDCVYVRIDSEMKQTKAGLYLGHGRIERDSLLWATVLKAGPRVRGLKPGQRTLVKRHAGWLVMSESPEVVVVKEDQCEIAAPPGTEAPKEAE